MRARMNFAELDKLAADLNDRELDALTARLMEAVERHAAFASAHAATNAPVFTGEGAGSIHPRGVQIERKGKTRVIRDVVKTNRVQMVVMERGRGRNKTAPPVENIERWVELKAKRGQLSLTKGTKKQTAKQVAWAIARAIKKRGQVARRFMRKAQEHVAPGFNKEVDGVIARFTSKVNR